jgi:peptide/nickel transport system ATP-binding protein
MNESLKPILEAQNLKKLFFAGSVISRQCICAAQEISFSLYPGHVTALVGESGSGKSTTARMLVRLYKPTSGDILFRGENVLKKRGRRAMLSYRSYVQMIFQDPFSSLNPVHIVRHHLARPLILHKRMKKGEDLEGKMCELLRRVALTPEQDFLDKYPHQLSGGQRQRVAIARVLAVEPEVILADEPISMLDVSIRMGILNLMERLRDEENISFLYVTHDLASARYFSNWIMVMYAGFIVEGGPAEELIQEPMHPYTQLLLSSVPDPNRGLRKDSEVDAKGEVPTLTPSTVGCPFRPRCKFAMDECALQMPPITTTPTGHWVRCYKYS